MKKFFLVFAVLFSFCCFGTGCGAQGASDSDTASDSYSASVSDKGTASDINSSDGASSSRPNSSSDGNSSSSASSPDSSSADDPPKPTSAKVVLMSGQSNMLGCTFADYLTPASIGADRYAAVSGSFDGVKILLQPGDSLADFVPVRLGQGNREEGKDYVEDAEGKHKCFGPEVGMAETLSQRFPDETVYLIKFAVGGSSLYADWRSESRAPVSYNYVYFKRVVDSGLKILSDAGLDPKIVGMCWMQGEADAESTREAWSLSYESNLETFVSDLRAVYDDWTPDGGAMNFIDAYISDSPDWTFYRNVNAAKYNVFRKNSHNYLLDTLAPDLVEKGINGLIFNREATTLKPVDVKHYDSVSMLKLGNMFGEAVANLCKTAA